MSPRYAVTTAIFPGQFHHHAFDDVAFALHAALVRLGRDAVLLRGTFERGRQHIVLGMNEMVHHPPGTVVPPPDSVLYNLEQVFPGSPYWTAASLDLYRRHRVWDYSAQNLLQFAAWGIVGDHLPIGFVPELRRIPMHNSKEVDVLCVGILNPARQKVIDDIRSYGISVETQSALYGAERDERYSRARIVLNLHYYEAAIFEQVRVSYLLANGVFVISEHSRDVEEELPYADAVLFAPYDAIARVVRWCLAHPTFCEAKAERGLEVMTERCLNDLLQGPITRLESGLLPPYEGTPMPIPVPSLEAHYQALVATPSDINEHLPVLRDLASCCMHVTEMGTRSAVSTAAFLAAQPEKLVCYDLNRSPAFDALAALAGDTELIFYQGDVLTVTIEPTDLLFIDTWHVYQQLHAELERHSAKARHVIVLHDTTTFGECGEAAGHVGLWAAVEEFLATHPEWAMVQRYTNNNGLTILARRELLEAALPEDDAAPPTAR